MALGAPVGNPDPRLPGTDIGEGFVPGLGPFDRTYADAPETGSRMQHRELLATRLIGMCLQSAKV
jgi:hypothetical protein